MTREEPWFGHPRSLYRRDHAQGEATDLDRQPVTPEAQPVRGGSAVVKFPRALRSVEVYLLDSAGAVLDAYVEGGVIRKTVAE